MKSPQNVNKADQCNSGEHMSLMDLYFKSCWADSASNFRLSIENTHPIVLIHILDKTSRKPARNMDKAGPINQFFLRYQEIIKTKILSKPHRASFYEIEVDVSPTLWNFDEEIFLVVL